MMFGRHNTVSQLTNRTSNPNNSNPMKDFEVSSLPDDSISCLAFSPASLQKNYLIAGSWDNTVRCWQVEQNGETVPKSLQKLDGTALDTCWSDDGNKVFVGGCNKQVQVWDLATNKITQVAAHAGAIKTCHWIKSPSYACLMTGSWDKTLKFWDLRCSNPILNINLSERVYCADVDYPLAVVGTADRRVVVYGLENKPQELKVVTSPLKYEHRCVAIFRDHMKVPTGFALGSVEGRIAIHYMKPNSPKDNFTFKCHRHVLPPTSNQDIYAVNDIKFHPIHGTLATVGADRAFSFWDKNSRAKLKQSEFMEQSIVKCGFNHNGQIFAYAVSYDWSRGHEFYDPKKKNYIFLRPCFDELKPKG